MSAGIVVFRPHSPRKYHLDLYLQIVYEIFKLEN